MENSRSKCLAWKKCECWAYWEMKSLKSCKMCTNPDLSVGSGWTVCCIECVSFHSLCCRHKLVLNFLISRWLPSACTPAYLLACHPVTGHFSRCYYRQQGYGFYVWLGWGQMGLNREWADGGRSTFTPVREVLSGNYRESGVKPGCWPSLTPLITVKWRIL